MKEEEYQEKDEKQQHRDYFREYFTLALVLRGEVNCLEKIKNHIIVNYVDASRVKLIKPTYAKERLFIVREAEWHAYRRYRSTGPELVGEPEHFYFACVLRGETRDLEEIKKHIIQYGPGLVELVESIYSKGKLFIVRGQ